MEQNDLPSRKGPEAQSVLSTRQSSSARVAMAPLSDEGNGQWASVPSNTEATSSGTELESNAGALSLKNAYKKFLKEELNYKIARNWEAFPAGSRLHIARVPYDQRTKFELFKLFSQFGPLAQIALRKTYGFVQYHTPEQAHAALVALQGKEVLGTSISLEVSKPQHKDECQRKQSASTHPLPPRPKVAEPADVLLLLMDKMKPEFIAWVRRFFESQGLNVKVTGVLFNPGPVVEQAVFDGVRAVVGMNLLAERSGLIRMTVYEKIESLNQARFSDYADLYPGWAAQLIKQGDFQFLPPVPAPPTQQYEPQQLPLVSEPTDADETYDPVSGFAILE